VDFFSTRSFCALCIVDRSSSCVTKADIVFVVDSSGSINEHDKGNWDRVKNFAKNIVGKLDIGEDRVRVGMVEFGNEGFVQFYLNSHYNVPDITADIDRSVFVGYVTAAAAGDDDDDVECHIQYHIYIECLKVYMIYKVLSRRKSHAF